MEKKFLLKKFIRPILLQVFISCHEGSISLDASPNELHFLDHVFIINSTDPFASHPSHYTDKASVFNAKQKLIVLNVFCKHSFYPIF